MDFTFKLLTRTLMWEVPFLQQELLACNSDVSFKTVELNRREYFIYFIKKTKGWISGNEQSEISANDNTKSNNEGNSHTGSTVLSIF